MKKLPLACCLWILLFSYALGAPLVSIGTQYMLSTDLERRIPILVSSAANEEVEGLNLAVQIGDGGAVNEGVNAAPRITNLDITSAGTLFQASNTGSTPLYLGDGDNPPYLIALAETTTASGTLVANGVLAWLTVNPSGAALGSYRVSLADVAANTEYGPFTTDFAGLEASFPENDGWIQIVNLHEMKWAGSGNGNWTDTTWTNPQPPFPNYTANAVVDTAHEIDVTSAQEANSLAISGGGRVSVTSSGSLAITSNLTLSAGGTLEILGGASTMQDVSGPGDLIVDGASTDVTISSFNGTRLTLGSGTIHLSSAIASSGSSMPPHEVPEPSTMALLCICAVSLLSYAWRRSKRIV